MTTYAEAESALKQRFRRRKEAESEGEMDE